MNTERLDKFIDRHTFDDLDEQTLRLIVDLAFAEGEKSAVLECRAIIAEAKTQ